MQSLWQFANEIYAAPGVTDVCIQLQDEHEVDVCVLLLLLWLAHSHRAVHPDQLQKILRVSAEWNRNVVRALRGVRRWLKTPPELVDREQSDTLRSTVRSMELKSERLQLTGFEVLFADDRLGDQMEDAAEAARHSIRSYASALGLEFPAQAVDTLVTALHELNKNA